MSMDATATTTTVSTFSRITLWTEIREQSKVALPSITSMILYKIPWLISLGFVGTLFSSSELASAALATTICNVTGMSFAVGMNSALATLAGQSKGNIQATKKQKKKKDKSRGPESKASDETTPLIGGRKAGNITLEEPLQPLVFMYRGMFVLGLVIVPISVWWLVFGTKPFLLYLGQDIEIATMTQSYLRVLTPGLWFYSINWTMTFFCVSIGLADIPAYAAFVGCICHVPMNLLLLKVFNLGYLGVGIGTVIFQFIQPICMIYYMYYTTNGIHRVLCCIDPNYYDDDRQRPENRSSLSFWPEVKQAICDLDGVKQYVYLAIPGIGSISEWWASETVIFLGGLMNPYPALALSGMTIYQSILSTCFLFPYGLGTAGATRVSNELGHDNPTKAKYSAFINVLLSMTLGCVMCCILYFTPHTTLPSLFTSNNNVIVETASTIPLLAVYVLMDSIQISLSGIIRGCGKQWIAMPVVIFSYWIVGVPLGYYVAFMQHGGSNDCHNGDEDNSVLLCGIIALVFGMTIGTMIHMILLLVVVVGTTNWSVEAQRALERVAAKHEKQQEQLIRPENKDEEEEGKERTDHRDSDHEFFEC